MMLHHPSSCFCYWIAVDFSYGKFFYNSYGLLLKIYAICNLFHLVTFWAYHPECGQVLLRIVFSFTKYNLTLNQSVILREWIHEGFSFAFLD